MNIYHICSNCSEEFELTEGQEGNTGIIFTQEQCSHCGWFNNVWIRVEVHDG